MSAKTLIGTSGWHYKHWIGNFYPKEIRVSEMLSFYARYFDTVELNNTFYQLPVSTTVDSWRNNSPSSFCFAVKASRFITHMKKLRDPENSTRRFFSGVTEQLGPKIGPILFQLPPRWPVNLERLATFLSSLTPEYKYAFEFRDKSWLTTEVFDLLRKHNAALCIHDLGNEETPREITSDFTYLRFHGPQAAKYNGSYSFSQLETWAQQIESWSAKLAAIYVYFNNDVGGWAVSNALQLQQLVDQKREVSMLPRSSF
ncbi:MAG TPA: DUF72 domain-containing protein [Pyrinomonadaceae bacterium]|nr:DUF72 domain-containing protein [Pyrinomonadaceae bacterium]